VLSFLQFETTRNQLNRLGGLSEGRVYVPTRSLSRVPAKEGVQVRLAGVEGICPSEEVIVL